MRRFVVQHHAARALHFDFRLELGGVLVSWAVPKGPSLVPRVRRLAVRVEDHELAHGDFEGVLPDSEPGRGAVIIWDRGTWTPQLDNIDDADDADDVVDDAAAGAALAAGKLSFTLSGDKLRGRWHLTRTKPQGSREAWLLFKARDSLAADTGEIVADRPESVISGRTIDDLIATTRTR